MKTDLLLLPQLRKYAQFLYDHHLDALVRADLKRSFELELPLLKLFQNNEEKLFELSKKGIEEYLQNLIQNKFIEHVEKSMKEWKDDKLSIPRDKVNASDIALIYNIRKHSLISFLPHYTSDYQLIIEIIKEIEDYYTFQEEVAIKTFSDIKQEQIEKNINALQEAQRIARLGSWEWDIKNNKIYWSQEMYHIFEMEEEVISFEKYIELVHPEDRVLVTETVNNAYTSQTPYSFDHRIITKRDHLKWIHGKGEVFYLEGGKPVKLAGTAMDVTEQKEKDEKLKFREEQLIEAQSIAQVGSFDYDIKKNKLTWSKELFKIWGIEPKEAITYSEFEAGLHPEDVDRVNEARDQAFRNEKEFDIEYRVITPEKVQKHIWAKGKVQFDRSGIAKRFMGTAADVTSRKKLEQELKENEEKFRLLTENSTDVISRHSPDGIYLYVSPSCKNIYGYEQDELLGKNAYHFIHPEDVFSISEHNKKILEIPDLSTITFRYKRKDGIYLWMECTAKNIKEGDKILEIQIAARNITERKKAEEELKLKQLALQASNKELEAFSYTISHDLRSPLRAIDGFGRKLDTHYGHALDAEGKRLLGIVRTSAQHMGVLIDSLLDFSRLNRRQLKKYPVDMKELVMQVIEECRNENPDLKAQFILKDLPEAPADQALLHQVWHNLITNAIKFSSKVQHPVIEIGYDENISHFIFFVIDNGAGFQMEYKDKLFGVFQRLHSNEEFTGTGVGLATVQRIIHRHQGTVWAEGFPGKGATFFFSLPK